MKACFKTSDISQNLVLYTGLGRNIFGTAPEKLILYKIQMTSQSETVVDIFIQANDISNNSTVKRAIAYNLNVESGEVLNVLAKDMSCTTEYSIVVSKRSRDGVVVDVYFEYDVVQDDPFVGSYDIT
tara:strand:+ start:159 stop:539 length:381 start_codon:yes stop_codon:yes gene_type:complete